MAIRLGVDTLCWHLRLEQGATTVEHVLDGAAALRCECVQVNLHHLRDRPLDALPDLADQAQALGLTLLASGDFLGRGREGDDPAVGAGRIHAWLERARMLRSPVLRVVSGFYRADLMGRPDLIEIERRYVIDVLGQALPQAEATGVALLLENHSDFTAAEYRSIVTEVGGGNVGVFLDLINPIAALNDPLPVIRELSPLARAGHVKDYEFSSIQTDDAYHRRGFQVLYRYPGEGDAPLAELMAALRAGIGEREFFLTVEGLDNRADVDDQLARLEPSLELLRGLLR